MSEIDNDQSLVEECKRIVQEKISGCGEIRDCDVSEVSRSNKQYRIDTPFCGSYGLRTWSNAKPLDGGEIACRERDRVFRLLAFEMGAPNVCVGFYDISSNHPSLSCHKLALIGWVSESNSFECSSGSKFIGNASQFCEMLGFWVVVALAFGYRDWHCNNLLWSNSRSVLSLIDYDWSFDMGVESQPEPRSLLGSSTVFRFGSEAEHFDRGVENAFARLDSQAEMLNQILVGSSLPKVQNFRTKSKQWILEKIKNSSIKEFLI